MLSHLKILRYICIYLKDHVNARWQIEHFLWVTGCVPLITKCKFWDCIESAKIAARDIFDQDEQISHICNLKYIQIVNSCHNIMYGYIYIETYDSKYRSLEPHGFALTLYTILQHLTKILSLLTPTSQIYTDVQINLYKSCQRCV